MSTPTFVYELRDVLGVLLYVGIAGSLGTRLSEHKRSKSWWGDVADVQARMFPTREEARTREVALIAEHRPRHNLADQPGRPRERTAWFPAQTLAKRREDLPPDELLDLDEVAARMGWRHPQTPRTYVSRGYLPEPDVQEGALRLWRVATIDAWDDTRKAPARARVTA